MDQICVGGGGSHGGFILILDLLKGGTLIFFLSIYVQIFSGRDASSFLFLSEGGAMFVRAV